MKTLKLFLLMVLPVVLLSCNHNPNKKKDSNNTVESGMMVNNDNSVAKDEDFVKEAASGGMMEVELGKYAELNAQNTRVKNFGAMMVRDHSKANEELRTLATGKKMNLPGNMEDDHNDMVKDLQKKKGADFDKAYIKEMVDDHEKDIDKFKKQAENGNDPDLKAFAAKTLPTLQAHQDSAKNIWNSLK